MNKTETAIVRPELHGIMRRMFFDYAVRLWEDPAHFGGTSELQAIIRQLVKLGDDIGCNFWTFVRANAEPAVYREWKHLHGEEGARKTG